VGATCDDFSAIAQRVAGLGFGIHWWEIPPRRKPGAGDPRVFLPGGFEAAAEQVAFVKGQLQGVCSALEAASGQKLTEPMLREGIRIANRIRRLLEEIRRLAFTAPLCPLPALEVLIAEMLAIHYCSDRTETLLVLGDLLTEVRHRVRAGQGIGSPDAPRVFWVNPVADLRVMNLLEECGGRLCGSDFMFCHALDEIPEDLEPMEALARMALADPMVGSSADRADRVCREIRQWGAQGVVISRIPGASHCASEATILAEIIESRLGLPIAQFEVPPLTDSLAPALRTRLEALVETLRRRPDRR
jgi:benzoyl-CoA reductase/2-hydroxyglutaryl-CoA dehydratase subunit BcrC/BadD/HgdB